MTIAPSQRNRLILVALALVIVAWIIYSARTALYPFLFGLFMAYLLAPAVRWLERPLPALWPPRAKRVLAILTIYLGLLVLSAASLAYAVPLAMGELGRVIAQGPELLGEARNRLAEWEHLYRSVLSEEIGAQIFDGLSGAASTFGAALQIALFQTFALALQTFSVIIGLASIPVWLFYVLKDRERLASSFYNLFHPAVRSDAQAVMGIIDRTMGAYIQAQLFLAVVVGVVTSLGLLAIGIRFALGLGVIAGLFELIPIIGPILGAIPALLVTLATAPGSFLWVLLLYIGVQLVENNLLVPKIQGEAVNMHPAIIMLVLVVAAELAGFWGMLAAVPIAATGRDIFVYFYRQWGGGNGANPEQQ